MIVFNINALVQVIFLAIVFGIIYLINPNAQSIWFAYIPFFTVILTYKAGIKGKFFWIIPTWLVAVVIMFIYVKQHFTEDGIPDKIYTTLNYIMLVYITIKMFFDASLAFKKEFQTADLILKNINKTDIYFENNKKEFWAQITHTFVRPSFFYKNFTSIYNTVFRTTISKIEFINHYLLLIETIKNRLSISSSLEKIERIESYLQSSQKDEGINLDYGFLNRLAEVIDLEVKSLA